MKRKHMPIPPRQPPAKPVRAESGGVTLPPGRPGSILALFRHNRKWSQSQLAQDLGVSPTLISHWELDRRQYSVGVLAALANIFEVAAGELLGIKGDRKSQPADVRAIGPAIKALRLGEGLSALALASQLGLCLGEVQAWENGRRLPLLGNLVRIAQRFGVSVSDLLGQTNWARPEPKPVPRRRLRSGILARPEYKGARQVLDQEA